MNKINHITSFGSTTIKLNEQEQSMYLHQMDEKFIAPVKKYFSLEDMRFDRNVNPQELADTIDFDKFIINYRDGVMTYVGKDGGEVGADTFIGKILTKLFPDRAVFKDDVKPYVPEEEPIRLNIEI